MKVKSYEILKNNNNVCFLQYKVYIVGLPQYIVYDLNHIQYSESKIKLIITLWPEDNFNELRGYSREKFDEQIKSIFSLHP
ncbi:MAG: hypothetical protein AABY78_09085 [Nitrospirota bacterium]